MINILIWGAGNNAKAFINICNVKEVRILGIIDSNIRGTFLNYNILPPEAAVDLPYDILIVCSTSDLEILWQCRELGLVNCYSYYNKEMILQKCPELFLDSDMVLAVDKQYKIELQNQKLIKEQIWSNVFHDTVSGYKWYNVSSLSLGRSAIGYNFAYVMARVLESMHPAGILELGLGQSSKIINAYFQYNKNSGITYDLVEHDLCWVDFFKSEISMNDVNIHIKNIIIAEQYNDQFYKYDGLDAVLNNRRYNFISIDGPFGYKGKYIGRIDLIPYIPEILEDDWIILMDDYDRTAEKNAILLLEKKLQEAHIVYYKGVYEGENDVCILASGQWRFMTTL